MSSPTSLVRARLMTCMLAPRLKEAHMGSSSSSAAVTLWITVTELSILLIEVPLFAPDCLFSASSKGK